MSEIANIESLSFEEALFKLEEIVKKLESGKSNLDETINNYEYALKLKEFCSKKLEEAKIRIKIVNNNNEAIDATDQFVE